MKKLSPILKVISLLALLYFFFLSIGLIGSGFKCLGKEAAEKIINFTANPFIGLFIGVLVTSLVQSSSTVTSMVVVMVGSGVISIPNAIPIIMGANVGTSVTNTLVSVGHITRKDEFERAVSAATVHDFFNLLTISILFPIEWISRVLSSNGQGLLHKSALLFSQVLGTGTEFKFKSPLKMIIKPVSQWIKKSIQSFEFSDRTVGILLLGIAFILLFFALFFIVKLMKSMMIGKIENIFDKIIGKNPFQGLVIGIMVTAIVQSSSITTSLLVPMAAAGIINLTQVFPITLGANIGTTVTALMASFAVGPAGVTIALVHLFFNIYGIIIFWPGHIGGRLPMWMARYLGTMCYGRRYMAFVYVGLTFFLIPVMLIVISRYVL
jgi:sodium-dependent phosphate cotransporter